MRGMGEKAELDSQLSLRGWLSYKQMNDLHEWNMPFNFPEINSCIHIKRWSNFEK